MEPHTDHYREMIIDQPHRRIVLIDDHGYCTAHEYLKNPPTPRYDYRLRAAFVCLGAGVAILAFARS